jgi:hypothetical protein
MCRRWFALLGAGLLCACQPARERQADPPAGSPAMQILQQVLDAHGCGRMDPARIRFRFRGRTYLAERDDGRFRYERRFRNAQDNAVRDILTNTGFQRRIDGQPAALSAKDSSAYANSVNSVIYFALLPCFLQDPAVQAAYLGNTQLKGEPYHKIQVTFRQEGGGKDYEDTFVYWFHRDRHTLDYLAYNYLTDGGGARFREAFNIREAGGIRFADYINYKPRTGRRDVAEFDRLFEQGELEELSRIELTNIQVVPIHED